MQISHVIRGDDHISNTPRQLLLYEAFGLPPPLFGHISMIHGPNREKLSKRHGATDILEFKQMGYYPDAMVNHLALLGWSPEDGIELIERPKLETAFTNPKFSSSPALFDYKKLDFINGHFLRHMDFETLYRDLKPYLIAEGYDPTDPYVKKVVFAVKDYLKTLSDIAMHVRVFLDDTLPANPSLSEASKALLNEAKTKSLLDMGIHVLSQNQTDDFITMDAFKAFVGQAKQQLGLSGKSFFLPIRLQLTGAEHGLDMETLLSLLPRNTGYRTS